jgi:hypothetical protein
MITETNPTPITQAEIKVVDDPYIKVECGCVDHENVKTLDFSKWAASTTPYSWNIPVNRKTVGIHPNQNTSSINFTHTFNLPYTGYYQIEILAHFDPKYTGDVTLFDGTTQIENSTSLKADTEYYQYITYKPRRYSEGNHNFKVTLTRTGNIVGFTIRPLIFYTGDNEDNTFSHKNRLDFKTLEFTQNSVADMNTLTMTLPLYDTYFRKAKWYQPLIFDYDDIITVWLGETKRNTTVMFGGYITQPTYNSTEIELKGLDRLFDLDRSPLYQNFSIGGAAAPEGSTRPFTPFPSVYELARYLAQTNRYPINTYQIPHEYGMKRNFANVEEYNAVSTTVWKKYYDHRMGNPKPCLKLYIGENTGNASATLWQTDDPYDATEYNYLSLDYYASGASSSNPLPWNLQINMHTTGETSASAVNYTIQVNGGSGTNVIGSQSPKLNGVFNRLTFDLKKLFDKKIPSTHYYINSIKVVGTVTKSYVQSRRGSAIWLDNIISYKEISHSPKYASQDVKTPYEELKQLCERTNHAAYVDYADTREDDVLVVMPQKITTSRGVIDEKNNLISFEGTNYDPVGDEFCNIRHMTFNFDTNNAGSCLDANYDSVAHYKEKHLHDFNSDINTQADADSEVDKYLTEHQWPTLGFSVKCRGTTQLLPEQYATVNLPSYHIVGDYPVKTITHNYDGSTYTTSIDFGKSSHRFRNFVRDQRMANKDLNNRTISNIYSAGGNRIIGNASTGAFCKY